jgi:lipase chaperone LimK
MRRFELPFTRLLAPAMLLALAGLSGACMPEPESREVTFMPRSLADTEVDGSFTLDHAGRFVFDEHAQQAFDYFLTADGELSSDELQAWVEAELARRLPADQYEEALAAWQGYLAYREEAAAALADTQAAKLVVEQRMLAAIDEELGDAPLAVIERERITRGFALSQALEQSGDARELALAQLGADDTQLEGDALEFLAGHRAVELAKSAGATAEQVHAIRSEQFGADAADRLALLDAERAAWDARVSEFRAARAELQTGFVPNSDRLAQAIAELEAEHFSATELRRVRALDKLSTQG